MAFGLLSTGFARKRLQDIKTELEASFRAAFGTSINLLPQSVLGQWIGIAAEREALIWELAEAVYNSQYPDTASDTALDNAVRLTGTTRREATFSEVTLRLTGTQGTVVAAGFVASVNGASANQFVTTAAGTLGTGIDEIQTVTFSEVPTAGQWRLSFDGDSTALLNFDADAATVQTAIRAIAGLEDLTVTGNYLLGFAVTFTGTAGQQDQIALAIASNTLSGATSVTITITETIKGNGPFADVSARATVSGQITGQAGTITVIQTPTFGVTSVTNLLDATVGRARESDADLRLRRLEEQQRAGTATVEGIRENLLAVDQVTQALVVENTDVVTDIDGRPAKSFEAYVQGGDNQDIFDAIWASKPAGIRTYGTISGTIIDSQGFSQPIQFSRPIEALVYIDVVITANTDPNEGSVYPANGDDLVQAAILAYGSTFQLGQDIIVNRFYTPINTVPGVIGIDFKVGLAPSPTLSANIAIGATSIAVFDSTRTAVSNV